MTSADLRETLGRLGLRQVELARIIGVDAGTVSRWARDLAPIPRPVELLLHAWDHEPRLLAPLKD